MDPSAKRCTLTRPIVALSISRRRRLLMTGLPGAQVAHELPANGRLLLHAKEALGIANTEHRHGGQARGEAVDAAHERLIARQLLKKVSRNVKKKERI